MAAGRDRVHDTRAAERRVTEAPSTMRARNLAATDVTVLDLSQTGVRIASDAELQTGDEISIGLSGIGTRRAYVAWRRDGQYGCAFAKPLGPGEARDAFTSASVIRLGTPEQLEEATRAGDPGDLQELYGNHSLWCLPADAVLVLAAYLAALGWLACRLVLPA